MTAMVTLPLKSRQSPLKLRSIAALSQPIHMPSCHHRLRGSVDRNPSSEMMVLVLSTVPSAVCEDMLDQPRWKEGIQNK